MGKVVVDVPDGAYCSDCRFLKNVVLQSDALYADNNAYKTKRYLSATCVLFRNKVHGYHVEQIFKCEECRKWN